MIKTEIKNDAFVVRSKYKAGWEMWVLLMSDEHYDSVLCDRKLLKRHHDEAQQRNALIFKFGDVFDCMGGKWDKRSSKEDIRPEYQKANYFDLIKKDAANFYAPYRDNIAMITKGNHELSILKNHEIDLIEALGESLNCHVGKYSGFIKFQFETEAGGKRKSFVLYYTHGSGGGAPVTKGVIKNNRRQHTIDADIYVSGHIHTGTIQPRPKVYLNEQCVARQKEPEHIILGAYKNEFMHGGWADTKEFDPAVLGGAWLRFYQERNDIHLEIKRAK